MQLTVSQVRRYPVKSCRGESVAAAVVEPWGLAGDRRWMLVDEDGGVVTAREHPPLVLVTPTLINTQSINAQGDGSGATIRFAAPGMPELVVPVPPDGALVPVDIFHNELLATPAGDAAATWFSRIAGEPVRLVYLDDPTRRPVDQRYADPGDRVSFADGYPLLLTSEDSLGALNELIAAGPHAGEGPLPMLRFRPSVVVSGAEPWAEDGWQRIRIGQVPFRVAKGCDRCVFTTIDPDTAAKGKEPLWTLARHRRWDGKVWFGVNLIPDTPAPGATIRPGDTVTVLLKGAPPGDDRERRPSRIGTAVQQQHGVTVRHGFQGVLQRLGSRGVR